MRTPWEDNWGYNSDEESFDEPHFWGMPAIFPSGNSSYPVGFAPLWFGAVFDDERDPENPEMRRVMTDDDYLGKAEYDDPRLR